MSGEEQVLIVGGGIAGLALARALHARGVPFLLIERRHAAADGGLAINLPGNAVRAISALGLGAELRASGRPLRAREYRTGRDRLLFAVDELAFWGDDLQPRSLRRSELMDLLANGLPVDSVRRGLGVRALALQGEQPAATLEDGSIVKGALIVGADGVRSAVRGAMFGNGAGAGHARIAEASWRFMARNPGVDRWTVWAGDDGVVLLMPVGEEQVYGWAAVTRARAGTTPHGQLVQLLASLPARARVEVAEADLYHSPLEEVRLPRWSLGRAVLIGDAAHATAPVWAEGAALAMEDAIILAEALSASADADAGLRTYEARRRPRVTHVQTMTDAMSKAARLPTFLRALLMPVFGPRRYAQTYGPLRVEP